MAQQPGFLCDGITIATRDPCTRMGATEIDDFHFCATHLRIYNEASARHGPRPAGRCHVISRARNYCRFDCAPGHLVCQRCLPLEDGGPRQQAHLLAGWNDDDLAELLGQHIRIVGLEDIDIPPALLAAAIAAPPGPPPFAADPQNVHRKEVSVQTNKATKFLLSVKLPAKGQNMLWKLVGMNFLKFAGEDMALYIDVLADILHWMDTETCREEQDSLYCRLMYGLIVYIQKSEHKDEMWKRLWEECCESLHMCCEGHISRLCNVLVGYVEGLDPPVALGEVLQQKMSAIASLEIAEADKKRMATEFFDEHGVPDAERVAWLDAF